MTEAFTDFMKDMLTASDNQFACSLDDETNPYHIYEYIQTGAYLLNAVLCDGDIEGGMPMGRKIQLAGPSSTAKSLFASHLVKQFITKFPNGIIAFFESEGSSIAQMCKSFDIPAKNIMLLPVATVEQFRNQMVRILDKVLETKENKRVPMMTVLDSLGMLASEKETADALAGSNKADMTRAKMIRSTMRCISLKLALAKIPLVIVNHTYAAVGSFFPTQAISGGGGTEYAPDVSLILGKAKEKDENKVQVGVRIRMVIHKSRYAKEGTVAQAKIFFKGGLFEYAGLAEYVVKYKLMHFDKKNKLFFQDEAESEDITKSIPANLFLKNMKKYLGEEKWEILRQNIKKEIGFEKIEEETFDDIDVSHIDLSEWEPIDLFNAALEYGIWNKISQQKMTLDDGSTHKIKAIRENPTPYLTDLVIKKIKIEIMDNGDLEDEMEEDIEDE